MKSTDSFKKLPTDKGEIAALVARAPGSDRPMTAEEDAQWRTGLLVNGGGYEAVRTALAAKRKPGERGPQVAPTKQLVSVRYSPEVLAFFRSGGVGWQSRMDEALKQWVSRHSKPTQ